MASDYYATLGVAQDASSDEIKKAYRKLAREHHPDANREDPQAEERFKEIGRAYDVLSDPEKRQRYDLFGDERGGAVGSGDFGGISDLFSTFFGGAGPRRARRGPTRGADIAAEVELTLEQAAEGIEREVEVATLATCTECSGRGSAPGTTPERCGDCGGAGELRQVRRTVLGQMVTATTCPTCHGAGEVVVQRCERCGGRGRTTVADLLTVRIPPGVDDGAHLRVSGRGEAGVRGGTAGDLYVIVSVEPHEVFRRAGDDLGCEVAVPMTVAALGGVAEIPTLEGPEEIRVVAGTQSGEVVRLKSRGMPRIDGRGRGELVGLLKVEIPTDLSSEEAELLQRLATIRDEKAQGSGLLDRIKGAFK